MKLEDSLQLPAGIKIFVGCGFLGLYNPTNPNPNPRNLGLLFGWARWMPIFVNFQICLQFLQKSNPKFLGLGLGLGLYNPKNPQPTKILTPAGSCNEASSFIIKMPKNQNFKIVQIFAKYDVVWTGPQ